MQLATFFPTILQPDSTEPHVVGGKTIELPVVHLAFKQWTGEVISDTWGGKGLIDYGGEPVFAELAIQRTAAKGGWNARWVETYSMKNKVPYYFSSWSGRPLKQLAEDLISDTYQANLLDKIASINGTYAGCWDVLAWNGDRTIFIESKRSKKDNFRNTQKKWLQSGLAVGLKPNNFLIVQWDFF